MNWFKKKKEDDKQQQTSQSEPQIVFQLDEQKDMSLEEVLGIPENTNALTRPLRLESSLRIEDKSITLGSIKIRKTNDESIPKYIINVSTDAHFWQMGIATMMISITLLYLMKNNNQPFILYADPQDVAAKLYASDDPVFIYHRFIKQEPDFNNVPPKEQIYDGSDSVIWSEIESLFNMKKDYLTAHYRQILARYNNSDVCEKGKNDIEKLCPQILKL